MRKFLGVAVLMGILIYVFAVLYLTLIIIPGIREFPKQLKVISFLMKLPEK